MRQDTGTKRSWSRCVCRYWIEQMLYHSVVTSQCTYSTTLTTVKRSEGRLNAGNA